MVRAQGRSEALKHRRLLKMWLDPAMIWEAGSSGNLCNRAADKHKKRTAFRIADFGKRGPLKSTTIRASVTRALYLSDNRRLPASSSKAKKVSTDSFPDLPAPQGLRKFSGTH
jgi:hypothetical protein